MTRCRSLLLILLLVATTAQATRDPREQCAAELFEQSTSTGNRLSRRALITGIVATLGGLSFHKYRKWSFVPKVRVVYSPEEALKLTKEDIERDLLVSDAAYDTTIEDREWTKAFHKKYGLDSSTVYSNRTYFGTTPLGANTIATFMNAMQLFEDEQWASLRTGLPFVFYEEAEKRPGELAMLLEAFNRLEQKDYFQNNFFREPRVSEVTAALKDIKRMFLQKELKFDLELKLEIDPKTQNLSVTNPQKLVGQLEGLVSSIKTIESLDERSFKLFLAAWAKEFSAILAEKKIDNPIAKFSQKIASIMLQPSRLAVDTLVKEYNAARAAQLRNELAKQIGHAQQAGVNVTVLVFLNNEADIRPTLDTLLEK